MTIALTIVQLIAGLVVTAIVLMQSGKSAGLSGAIAGAADTFLAKNKAKSVDAQLARITKWAALVFVVITIVLNMLAA
ncbi:MAG: preprotein translocase subunit SecG [Oscillospiraceae bacterium]|jgi:preprotein translocase subunit SecG|nr:preprotein translocase subunit SecG [Oscillospiraceae bacterium]